MASCLKVDTIKTSIFASYGLLFESRYNYNTPNQYQTLLSAKDHCVKNSEGSDNYNLSNHGETILSTDGAIT
jgi:predicted transcriptional regulator